MNWTLCYCACDPFFCSSAFALEDIVPDINTWLSKASSSWLLKSISSEVLTFLSSVFFPSLLVCSNHHKIMLLFFLFKKISFDPTSSSSYSLISLFSKFSVEFLATFFERMIFSPRLPFSYFSHFQFFLLCFKIIYYFRWNAQHCRQCCCC